MTRLLTQQDVAEYLGVSTRTVRVTEPWAWAIVRDYVKTLLPDAPLFPGLVERRALDVHKAACEAAKVAPSTLHDWRHTYAVQALRDGLPPQTVKRQLGHSPHSTLGCPKGILSPRQRYGKSTTCGALSLCERRRAEVSGSQRKDVGYQFGYQWPMREVAP